MIEGRANVFVHTEYDEPEKGVYLYTHDDGDISPLLVRDALARRERWDDPPYLCRIIFCEMIKGDEFEATGYGISLHVNDNEHPLVRVNPRTKTVSFHQQSGGGTNKFEEKPSAQWSFDDYVRLDDSEIEHARLLR
jgi:hypothetical protein